jgi:hypothetical protein
VTEKYFGWLRCEKCTISYITNAGDVVIWLYADDTATAEVKCKCGDTITAPISTETFVVFRRNDVIVKNFVDQFEPLTEEMIEGWDVGAELKQAQFLRESAR